MQVGLLALCQMQVLRHGGGQQDAEEAVAAECSQAERRDTAGLMSAVMTNTTRRVSRSLSWSVYSRVTQWTTWHFCGCTLLCLPFAGVVANFSCETVIEGEDTLRFFCYLSFVAVIHFCNFAQLNCWLKNFLATICCVCLVALLATPFCPCTLISPRIVPLYNSTVAPNATGASTQAASSFSTSRDISLLLEAASVVESQPGYVDRFDLPAEVSKVVSSCIDKQHWFHVEIIVTFSLLLSLVWLLNREFEISYRLSFYGWVQSMQDKIRVQAMKNQAEWMLHNIIPKHVANKIKPTNAKYSENHTRVAIMFASIVNFNEFYDESFCGGKECLRYLNELVGDFDELLQRPHFENIIKIKTIGSTYMAASGLNPDVRRKYTDPNHHIFEMVEFARELQRAIHEFNKDLLEFNFILRIGVNFGDVTAGVIGTTKLYYDIWGDAVNIASRMDSTGVKNRIQVNEECAEVLRLRYELEPRGQVFVKGKDNMNVFLLKDVPSVDN